MNKEIRKQVKALEKLRLPELRARFAEVLGEETRAPNRAYLIRRITEALEARAEAATHPDEVVVTSRAEVPAEAAPGADSAPAAQPGEKLSQLPIADLQARYLETVGRPTSSDDRRYLVWKIREARKGRVPVGPRRGRRVDGEAPDFKVLPLRLETALVTALDQARERLGLRSRMDLLRRSIHLFLVRAGEVEAAARFAPEA